MVEGEGIDMGIMTPTFEIIQYTVAELILLNKITGKQYSYFGCPRSAYDKIKSLLANSRNKEAWQALRPYASRGLVDRVKDEVKLEQGELI